jgi:two-component system sensor histidine kinase YesM
MNFTKRRLTGSDINELEDLSISFQEMGDRLNESIRDLMKMKEQELKLRISALQTQMNPHFLYNMITIISIMAEEKMNESIIEVCQNLNNLFRYISDQSLTTVDLEKELENTENYLNLMKIRYDEDLNYEIDVPETMLHIQIPKLIIQPLVENCIKYGMKANPPWNIRVKGEHDRFNWKISVNDNGNGFSPELLEQMKEQLESIRGNIHMSELHIDGMGMQNIFRRLLLMYGLDTLVDIGNGPDGGAMVMISGRIGFGRAEEWEVKK